MRHSVIEEDLKNIAATPLPWHELQNRTVLVTGANGFLPAYMVETLLYLNETISGQNTRVVALVRNHEKAKQRFAHYQGRSDLQFIVQDVTSPLAFDGSVDFVIHAASQASPKYYGADPVGTLGANVLGTHHLLHFAREKGVRGFLFFSSGEVYGQAEEVPTPEHAYGYVDPTNVRSCYAESKRMGETMCVSWHHQYGVPVKVVRPFHTYGPGLSLQDGRVFADFIAAIVHKQNIVLNSDGSARRAFCYLADATAGFFTVLFKGEAGQAYNVGNDQAETSILELAQTLTQLFPEKQLKAVVNKPDQALSQPSGYLQSTLIRNCPDISKISALGWQPTTSIEEGFTRSIRSFQ